MPLGSESASSAASNDALMDEKRKDQLRSLVGRTVDTALVPFYAAVSKPAQKAYLGTAFFAITSIFLLCVASAAYWIFYFSYIPQVGIDRVIHLQFGDGNPSGITTLSSSLTSQQAYDVTIFLQLPLTPSNIAAGNFMVDLRLLAPETANPIDVDAITSTTSTLNTSSTILARSRRPAILTYTSTLVNTANTFTNLPWYVLGWKKESEALAVPMFEGVQFSKGSANIPDTVHLTIEPSPEADMQFYDAGVRIVARFGGLRWLLYHHKFLSFFVFTGVFWGSSVLSMLLVWLGLSIYFAPSDNTLAKKEGGQPGPNGALKSELADSDAAFDPTSLEDLSDTSRTFPTLARGQAPLKFSSGATRAARAKEEEGPTGPSGRIKKEGEAEDMDRAMAGIPLSPLTGLEAEADDEDEDEDFGSEWRDSGIGTSREDERRKEVRRRRRGG